MNKAALKERAADLFSKVPPTVPLQATSTLIDALNSAIDAYFIRDGDFVDQAYSTLKRVVFDGFMQGLRVEHSELLPPVSQDYPVGYDDITALFDGGGAITEIMAITQTTFNNAFTSETDNSTSPPTAVWKNAKVDDWIAKLAAASGAEIEGMKALEEFCLGRFEVWTLALIFEEVGHREQFWRGNKQQFAKWIYITRKWDQLILSFGLDLFEPSYIGEIR